MRPRSKASDYKTLDTLTVDGILDSLKSIRDFVVQAAEKAGLDKRAVYRLNLAVDEIATNIILHGYQEANLEGTVVVSAIEEKGSLRILLEDTGLAYNPPGFISSDDLNQPLDQRSEGGLGVYLAQQNVDRFSYERIGERNIHTFIVNLSDGSEY
jgi:serine/threonine-protein kinase RsbW